MIFIGDLGEFDTGFGNEFDFQQPNEYLEDLGMQSGSVLANNMVSMIVLAGLVILHFAIVLIYSSTRNQENGFCNKVFKKLFNVFTFTLYIRIAIESFTFTLLMSVSEIKFYFYHDIGNQGSIICTFIVLLILMLFILL